MKYFNPHFSETYRAIGRHLSNGNRKIGKDTLIINMNSATDCPAKSLGLCKIASKCYAMKSERFYPQVLPYRRRQADLWKNSNAKVIATAILLKAARLKTDIKYLRFSESGDFETQCDVDKMQEISDILWNEAKIVTYGYTARCDLKIDSSRRYFVCTMSDHYTGLFNNFEPVKHFSGSALECKGDCSACNLCKVQHGKTIEVILH